ncbi:N-acetylmuramoyl-L-alanine amidase [Sporosarcina sp. G11-34]|uniref:N-acetylmuramoyl-L-alanine amidase n=1 Tax=Sporosarcina sp. G11-34 TaxID=2849605 RepID=UPI0022A9E540|nr:N-acetylmuramoyl-L-alanine amidase [Sporosarcina sp. G11-34]
MPKATKWVIVFTLLLTMLLNAPVADAKKQSVAIDSKSLNVRSGPGLTYDVIGSLKKGERVEIISVSGDWLQLSAENGSGWIASWLTTSGDKANTGTTNSTIVSRVDSLNIRTSPSVSSAILGKMNAGDEAIMTVHDGDWAQVIVNGTKGWVHTDYITETAKKTAQTTIDTKANTFTVAVDTLNVRKNADLSSRRVGVIKKNESYKIKKIDGNWILISFGKNKEGWVYSFHGNVSSASTTTKQKSSKPKSNTVTILSNGTNLRESATTSSRIVTRADAGEHFTITSKAGDWYEVALPNAGTAFLAKWVVSTNEAATNIQQTKKKKTRVPGTLIGLTIVIDPGHGGNDRGTTGVRGTDEKDINLLTSELLASKLQAAGANVFLTRESDTYVSLRKRVAVGHQHDADAFISIHYDATTDSSVKGFTTYYTIERQKSLAKSVNKGLASSVTVKNRGTQLGNYLVLRENRQNAILIELGFLTNAAEERTVTTEVFREQATLGIYEGLIDYFNSN